MVTLKTEIIYFFLFYRPNTLKRCEWAVVREFAILSLRPPDEDPGGEDQASAYDDLKTGESEAGLEVAVTDKGDDDQLNPDDRVGPGEGGVNVGDEKGQRVKKA